VALRINSDGQVVNVIEQEVAVNRDELAAKVANLTEARTRLASILAETQGELECVDSDLDRATADLSLYDQLQAQPVSDVVEVPVSVEPAPF